MSWQQFHNDSSFDALLMTTDKIFVLMIDGTDVWVPVNARQKDTYQYELLPDSVFDELDKMELIQFFPGDEVLVEEKKFLDGTTGLVAQQLITAAPRLDRDYLEFQFYAARNSLTLDKEAALKYREIIRRIKAQLKTGEFFYPSIVKTVMKLDELLDDTK